MADTITLIPSAKQLITSLRDIGYDFSTAVADLIDNSIAADATEVAIDLFMAGTGSGSAIRISDNGRGMSTEVLEEALRFGNRRTYTVRDLGKFGLGLKTASLSQCRRLTVATRQPSASDVQVCQWDLDHIEETDTWEALRVAPSACQQHWIEPLIKTPGTVVTWDHLDRVAGFKVPDGRAAMAAMYRLCHELEEHVSMVFHRFLADEAHRNLPLRILVNGTVVEPWDPFSRSERNTQTLPQQTLRFEHDGQAHSVDVSPYVLPNEAEFSSPKAHALAAGPNKWNHQQGFYIYRNDRMIQSGGWNRLRTPDEHTKLARVALDFNSGADSAFGINVAKMKVRLPLEIRNQLTAIVSGVVGRANAAYRGNSGKAPAGTPRGVGTNARAAPGQTDRQRTRPGLATTTMPPGVPENIIRVLVVKLADEPATLGRVLGILADEFPEVRSALERIISTTG